jgi:integrase
LQAVDQSTDLRSRTFLNYANCLRTVAAEVFRVHPPKGKSKFDYRNGGNQEWRDRVDGIKLARLSSDLVISWQRRRVAAAGKSEVARASARRTCNSYVRCARSLFAPAILKNVKNLEVPDPLPFAGVELLENGSMKYVSRINAHTLIAAAKSTLKPSDPEAYKAFLLALFAGMRKSEIDLAEWRMADFGTNVIRLEETEWLHLKTHDSAGEITIDAEVGAELQSFKPLSNSKFIVSSTVVWKNGTKQLTRTRKPRNDSPRSYYRCEPVFQRLNEWLRSQGIAANKPLHELRKEVGAVVATTHGIYAASRYLRHADITTTARHYADQKERINVGLGKLLDTSIKSVPQSVPVGA